ncbi:18620_t:CDS:2 [Entrophospora sp. SA101]|nr:18620_t:CDS:2 [Entrophospora sp. SA101]
MKRKQNQINNDDTEQINDDLPAVIEETISAASNEEYKRFAKRSLYENK